MVNHVSSDPVADFAAFLQDSPTSYHAVEAMAARLDAGGFVRQREEDAFDGTPGGHYIVRDGALIAYRLPAGVSEQTCLRIVGAHTDSPAFKLKPLPEHRRDGYAQAGAEVYGGPLLNSWLDRDLAVAGRVVLRDGSMRLVRSPAWLRIPQLAVHLDRSVNDALHLDPQAHLMPVYGLDGGPAVADGGLLGAVARLAGLASSEEIAGHDLFLVTTEAPAVLGVAGEFLASRRLDNLSSVWAGLTALLAVEPPGPGAPIPVLACFDHEEVGSSSRSGAAGPFLACVVERILLALGITGDDVPRCWARSWFVSSDTGHAVNPNYPGKSDPDERPVLNGGPMLKVNARHGYTTEGPGESMWRRACEAGDVPVQVFVSSNDVPCGSTIGPFVEARLGVRTVDVGVPILSMHSARELVGTDDPARFARAFGAFFVLA